MTMDIQQAAAQMQAKQNSDIAKRWARRNKPVRYWPLYGLRYRVLMRTMHWLGWCYMKPLLGLREGDGSIPPRIQHWCQWCGMRGFK